MSESQQTKMGRRKNTGNTKVRLGDLVESFKLDTQIPISYTFAREFDLLPVEKEEAYNSSELILD